MTEVEKKGIGKVRIGLVVCGVLIVIVLLAIKVVDLYGQVIILQTDIDNLRNELNSLEASQLHEVNVEWSDYHPLIGSPHISISGAIFNSGTDTAYNVICTIKIYDSADTLLKSEEFSLGIIEGKSYENFDTTVLYDGDADYIETTLKHD